MLVVACAMLVILIPSLVYILDEAYVSKFSDSLDILYIIGTAGVRLAENYSMLFTLLNIKRMKTNFADYSDFYEDTYFDALLAFFKEVIDKSEMSNSEMQLLL